MRYDPDPICGKCGYPLRGLSVRGNCPECGNAYDIRSREGLRRRSRAQDKADRVFALMLPIGLYAVAALLIVGGALAGLSGSIRGMLTSGGTGGVFLVVATLLVAAELKKDETA